MNEQLAKTIRAHHRLGHHDQWRGAPDRAEAAHARAGGLRYLVFVGTTATPTIKRNQASHSEEGGQDQEGRQDMIFLSASK